MKEGGGGGVSVSEEGFSPLKPDASGILFVWPYIQVPPTTFPASRIWGGGVHNYKVNEMTSKEVEKLKCASFNYRYMKNKWGSETWSLKHRFGGTRSELPAGL